MLAGATSPTLKQLLILLTAEWDTPSSGRCELSKKELGWKILARILVVDDNPSVRSYLRSLLEQQGTWQVCDEARTGREALQRVTKSIPDLILLDFQMPDLNGLEVARQVVRLCPEIPILMVTIHLSKQLAEEARKVGIRGACAKSDVSSIVEAVDTLLHEGTYFPMMKTAAH